MKNQNGEKLKVEYHRDQFWHQYCFLVYVNDMTEGVSSYVNLFANNAKLLRKIGNHKDCEELQNDINKICEWSKTWEMEFNEKKMPCIGNGKNAMKYSRTLC